MNLFSFPSNLFNFTQTNTPFTRNYECFSAEIYAKNIDQVNEGDKIILPQSALTSLTHKNVQFPMVFELSNLHYPENKISCGVLEFTAPEQTCIIPKWMMDNINVGNKSYVKVLNISLPKGTFVCFKPLNASFLSLTDPRVVLERKLRSYTTLTKGSTIMIHHLNESYYLKIVDLKPADSVSIFDTDLFMEFQIDEAFAKSKSADVRFTSPSQPSFFSSDIAPTPNNPTSSQLSAPLRNQPSTPTPAPLLSDNNGSKRRKISKTDQEPDSISLESLQINNGMRPSTNPKNEKSDAGRQKLRWSEDKDGFRYFYARDRLTDRGRLVKREPIVKDCFKGKGYRL